MSDVFSQEKVGSPDAQGYSFSQGMENVAYEEWERFIMSVERDFVPPFLLWHSPYECYQKWSRLGRVLACRCRGKLVAFCCYYDNDAEGRRAYVTFIAVDREHRGRGIATTLLRQAESRAAASGMRRVGIHTNSGAACRLYTGLGYAVQQEEHIPEGGYTRYYLEKDCAATPLNILLSSAGRRTYLVEYFKSALAGKGKVHASNSVMTYTLAQADKHVLTPAIYDESYIDFMLAYCRKEHIAALIPLFDIDVPVLARNRGRFEAAGVRLLVPSERVCSICNDKWETFRFLTGIGCAQPASYISLAEAERALEAGEIHYPLIVKPRWGMGSIGIYQAETLEELRVFYQKLRRELFRTYLRYESRQDEESCVLIQEKIQGEEYGLDVLNDLDGNYVTTVAKKKLAMRAGETDVAEIVDCTPFEPLGRQLSEALSHTANLDVDCFVSAGGELYVLELNCRFGGQYPFSHLAGVDFPRQIVAWLEGGESEPRYYTPRVGTVGVKELAPAALQTV